MYQNNRRQSDGYHRGGGTVGYNRRGTYERPQVTGGCMFCVEDILNENSEGHQRNQCPIFKALKRNTSPEPYIAASLKRCDTIGYAAAGVLPWRRHESGEGIELLLAREYRVPSRDRGGDCLNFLGGKRLRKGTTPLDCAVDKVQKETGGQLSPATMVHMRKDCPLVCWSSYSKNVLFVFEMVGSNDYDVDVRCAGLSVPGVQRLEWVTRKEITNPSWVGEQMHLFASEILQQLLNCNIMNHLEVLFDVGVKTSSPCDPILGEGILPEELDLHFDLVDAIRSSVVLARPDRVPCPNPLFSDLKSMVADIPSSDKKKLKRRFHPDRISQVLGRVPTSVETHMSTIVMQALNGLCDVEGDAEGSSRDIMANIEKLNKLCGEALLRHVGKEVLSDEEKLEEILSRLSMEPT